MATKRFSPPRVEDDPHPGVEVWHLLEPGDYYLCKNFKSFLHFARSSSYDEAMIMELTSRSARLHLLGYPTKEGGRTLVEFAATRELVPDHQARQLVEALARKDSKIPDPNRRLTVARAICCFFGLSWDTIER